ncbi:MAG: hypothetical protein MJD61_07095 [Proteobacteria bacterium]|nr:hypothetical protein [Pseudomonadota bacterium]
MTRVRLAAPVTVNGFEISALERVRTCCSVIAGMPWAHASLELVAVIVRRGDRTWAFDAMGRRVEPDELDLGPIL